MDQQNAVEQQVLEIYKQQLNREEITVDETFQLSSIETLNMLAQIERVFFVEIEDELVFHGLFSNITEVSKYIVEKLYEE